MAQRARLVAPTTVRGEWPWHHARTTTFSVSELADKDRRFEAGSYLGSGYGIRRAFQSRTSGWTTLGSVANSWMPGRLKAIVVSREFGWPYLSATQVFDLRPVPRKFIALSDTMADILAVKPGSILVTRSGSVGRSVLAHKLHNGVAITDDLVRVDARDPALRGWIYAYLRSPSARKMMTSSHYGHVIKHLEPEHIAALPIPLAGPETSRRFEESVAELVTLRNRAYEALLKAEALFERYTGTGEPSAYRSHDIAFERSSVDLFEGRRRLEASYSAPVPRAILDRFARSGLGCVPLSELSDRVWWGARFRRVFGEGGLPYFSADDLWSINPNPKKRILVEHENAGVAERYMVKPGWIIMACSGQVYGINGSVDLVTEKLANSFLSHDLIRIRPNSRVPSGYLLIALGHPFLGRPLVVRNAYGSSIPHLDPDDIAATPIVRLRQEQEQEIADLAKKWIDLREQADALEDRLERDAEFAVEDFLSGRTSP